MASQLKGNNLRLLSEFFPLKKKETKILAEFSYFSLQESWIKQGEIPQMLIE